jgi:hypothetical protein
VTHRSRLFAGAALLAGFGFAAAPTAAPADLPKDALKLSVPADVAALQKKLEELAATPKPGTARTARALALILIDTADEPTKAAAAKVFAGIDLKKKDFAAGIDAGKGLANPAGKFDPKSIEGKYDLHEVMQPFALTRSGGLNIEKDIRDYIKAGKVESKDAIQIGARVAALATYTTKLPTDKAMTNPTMKAKWERWAGDMAKAGKELCETAGKNDAKAMLAALKKLDASCSNCHNDFRNE